MGAFGRWFKALMGVKKLSRTSSVDNKEENEGLQKKSSNEKSRRWGPLKHSSAEKIKDSDKVEQHESCGENPLSALGSATCPALGNAIESGQFFTSLQTKQEEWAAVRIQTAFRGFLSRRALKALKGLVRLQALVRGHQVRKQAAMTLHCMQALVRVQARVRACHVRMSEEGLAVQRKVDQRRFFGAPQQASEKRWCDTHGTVEDIQARLQQKQEGAIKRDRALAYAFSHQWRPKSQLDDSMSMGYEPDRSHWGWAWLERWMAAKPWENRSGESLKEDTDTSLKSYDDAMEIRKAMERSQVTVRRNKVSVRVVPPRFTYSGPLHSTEGVLQTTPRSSGLSLDAHDGSSPSSSSKGTTPTSRGVASGLSNSHSAISTNSPLGGQHTSNEILQLPGYMVATQSAKAKCRIPLKLKPSCDHLNLKRSDILFECGDKV